jgi:protein-L-isoaspartate(D-aspartate) O-methyltransferase
LQDQLIEKVKRSWPVSEPVIQAFYRVPRHHFIRRFLKQGHPNCIEVTSANLEEHLALFYEDRPITLHGEGGAPTATISQPTMVLGMLELLQLEPGQKVFELGAGSGWNAALIGNLVGPGGKVVSVEIIPELAQSARETIESLGLGNVSIRQGDGGDGCEQEAPFDRAVFTAAAYDLPRAFYRQVKDGGLLLFVFQNKIPNMADHLLVLRKVEDHFESVDMRGCSFVPLSGKYQRGPAQARPLDVALSEAKVSNVPTGTRPFWGYFFEAMWPLCDYLSLTEPGFEVVQLAVGKPCFALRDGDSWVVAEPKGLVSYGNSRAQQLLVQKIKDWIELGTPMLFSMKVRAYPKDIPVTPGQGQWVLERPESRFVFSLAMSP